MQLHLDRILWALRTLEGNTQIITDAKAQEWLSGLKQTASFFEERLTMSVNQIPTSAQLKQWEEQWHAIQTARMEAEDALARSGVELDSLSATASGLAEAASAALTALGEPAGLSEEATAALATLKETLASSMLLTIPVAVSVESFGADPTGVTDSTAAIQAAVDAAGGGDGTPAS